MKNYKKNGGITLIALTITIIILLILASISITVLFDGGLIKKTGDAQEKMNDATQNDVDELDTLTKYMEERTGELAKLDSYEEVEKNNNGTVKENSKYKDGNGDTAIIPEGYKVSDEEDEKTISEGLVIKDADENEFVWVPVKKIDDYKLTSWNGETVKEGVKASEADDAYFVNPIQNTESILSKKEENVKVTKTLIVKHNINSLDNGESNNTNSGLSEINPEDLLSEKESVAKYGGFYIGRYEASYNSTNKKIETKKGKVPYTNIDLTIVDRDADMAEEMESYLSDNNKDEEISTDMNLFKLKKVEVKKAMVIRNDLTQNYNENYTLGTVTGLQWDAMLKWINGTNETSAYNTNGHKGTSTINTGSNESYKVNNIYDIAGNVSEYVRWEYYGKKSSYVYRGANYSSENLSANIRANTDNAKSDVIGTRQSIFIGPVVSDVSKNMMMQASQKNDGSSYLE